MSRMLWPTLGWMILSEVSDLAEQLRANGADEYKTYMQFLSAFSRGVSLLPVSHECGI